MIARTLPTVARSIQALVLLAVLAVPPVASQDAVEADPWEILEDLRDRLGSEPMQARFVQTYMPAGFSTGDQEAGRLYLALPDCVRWDYEEPFAKFFLLCGDTIHTWNPGETAGRRYLLTEGNEPGVDLLRLQIEALRLRYSAMVVSDPKGSVQVVLSPVDPTSSITEARLILEEQSGLLSTLAYRDLEGNASRFDLSGYESLTATEPFAPPADLDWLDQ